MTNDTSGPEENRINPELAKLIDLQRLDTEILRKKNLLAKLPLEIEESYSECEEAKSKLADFDESLKNESKTRRELEREVESIKDKITKDNAKLGVVKTNVEYTAMLKELENYKNRITELEDKELELMEAAEGHSGERSVLEKAFKEEEASFAVVKKEKEQAIAELEKLVAELVNKRSGVISEIDATVLGAYERILKARDGVGVAEVKDMTCLACHQFIPPQLFYHVKETEELFTCPHCSRYLYYNHEADKLQEAQGAQDKK